MLKKAPTWFLKASVVALGLIVLALCIFALPQMFKGGSAEFPEASLAVLLITAGLYATAIPFFVALWQALKLLHHIEKGEAFSQLSIGALKRIKYCAIIIGVLYIGGVPLLFPIAEADDAPGLILIWSAVACIPLVIAVFASVLEKLFQRAAAAQA